MQKVASLAELPDDRGVRVDLGDEKIVLVRDGSAVRAYGALCPHAGAPLDEGAVCHGRLVCPWHKATFRVSDGALLEPPALRGLTRYAVRIEGDDVLVAPEPLEAEAAAWTSDERLMLIAGGGAAGAAGAAALREFGFEGRILLVGREPGPPFDRTALSKFVVAGQMKPDDAPPLLPAGFEAEQRIERIEGEVTRLDGAARRAVLADGREMAFEAALVATGAVPKTLDIPGAHLAGVHVLRTRRDAAAILSQLRPGARAVVLGSSFIGLEVACGLREQHVEVDVVSPDEIPFARQFGERIGSWFRRLHEAHGVRFHAGQQATGLCGEQRVDAVLLDDGSRLPADLVLLGVGVRPATDMVEGVERSHDGGVVTDAGMRAAPGVYAAGDIAAFPLLRDGGQARIEHWRVAQQQARIAARNMLGGDASFAAVPFFWTYHYGKRFEYLGHADTWDQTIVEGDLDAQRFVALLVRGGLTVGMVACDRERATAVLAERLREPLGVEEALRIARTG